MLFDRLFTFGCSFTKYHWMTWADILGMEAKQYNNTGLQGAGNLQIFIKLIEANQLHRFGPGDSIIIMWSSTNREDRTRGPAHDELYNNWLSPGNIHNQTLYPQDWVSRFADAEWYLRRDLALITGAASLLQPIGVDLHMTSMLPMGDPERLRDPQASIPEYLSRLHQPTLRQLLPSLYEVIFDGHWGSREPRPKQVGYDETDPHPTPVEHMEFVRKTWPEWPLSNRTLAAVHAAQSQLQW